MFTQDVIFHASEGLGLSFAAPKSHFFKLPTVFTFYMISVCFTTAEKYQNMEDSF